MTKEGFETIIINNNPETVSTDFDVADKLYFEPLTPEDVENIVNIEKPDGAVVQFGGQGMKIAYNEQEIEVDAVCDGTDILIPGIMEHIERTGVHSGDSISVYPAPTISEEIKATLIDYTERLAQALHVVGLINIKFIVMDEEVYVIEVNPRSSRTVPYISKVTGSRLCRN